MADSERVTFVLGEDEYIAAGQFSLLELYRKPSGPIVICGGASILFLAVGVVLDFVKGGEAVNWLPTVLVALAISGMFALSYFIVIPASYRRSYRHHAHIHEPITWTWDDVAFEVSTENSRSRLEWKQIYRWSESQRFIMVYVAPRLMHILPKRAVTAEQIAALRSFAKA